MNDSQHQPIGQLTNNILVVLKANFYYFLPSLASCRWPKCILLILYQIFQVKLILFQENVSDFVIRVTTLISSTLIGDHLAQMAMTIPLGEGSDLLRNEL